MLVAATGAGERAHLRLALGLLCDDGGLCVRIDEGDLDPVAGGAHEQELVSVRDGLLDDGRGDGREDVTARSRAGAAARRASG